MHFAAVLCCSKYWLRYIRTLLTVYLQLSAVSYLCSQMAVHIHVWQLACCEIGIDQAIHPEVFQRCTRTSHPLLPDALQLLAFKKLGTFHQHS